MSVRPMSYWSPPAGRRAPAPRATSSSRPARRATQTRPAGGGRRSVAGRRPGVGERGPGLGNELPVVTGRLQRELEHAEGGAVPDLAAGDRRPEPVVAAAAGADDERA